MLSLASTPTRFSPAFSLLLALAAALLGLPAVRADEAPRFEGAVTSGFLTRVGGGATPLDYEVVPVIVSLKLPTHFDRAWHGGQLTLRPRFDLLLEPIVRGPESFFGGATAAGEFEWRHPTRSLAGFLSSGGGIGWLDSHGYEIPGAQGQDFNFTWFVHAGLRVRTPGRWLGAFGLYFQHISNHGLNKINPGVNLLGPTFTLSRRF